MYNGNIDEINIKLSTYTEVKEFINIFNRYMINNLTKNICIIDSINDVEWIDDHFLISLSGYSLFYKYNRKVFRCLLCDVIESFLKVYPNSKYEVISMHERSNQTSLYYKLTPYLDGINVLEVEANKYKYSSCPHCKKRYNKPLIHIKNYKESKNCPYCGEKVCFKTSVHSRVVKLNI